MQPRDTQRAEVARRRAQPWREESPPGREAWEYAALAAGTKEQMAEWVVVEQPGRTVLIGLAFSQRRAKRALAQRVRVAPAVFARSWLRERLVWGVARREKALAASGAAAAAQVASPKWETTPVRAVLLALASPRVVLEPVFLLLKERPERQSAAPVHLELARRGGLRR